MTESANKWHPGWKLNFILALIVFLAYVPVFKGVSPEWRLVVSVLLTPSGMN